MLKKLLSVVFSLALIGVSGLALAKHGGDAGGKSESHMSTQGAENTNGPDAADRDKGQARAEDRQSDKATDHEKGKKHKGKHEKKQ